MKLTIYHGTEKPAIAIGKNQCELLEFAERYRGWHSYSQDRSTLRAVEGLVRRGCIEVNNYEQFRFCHGY